MSRRKTIFRGSLYVVTAMLTYLSTDMVEGMSAFAWTKLGIGATLAGLLNLKAFVDQTPSQEQWEQKEEQKKAALSNSPLTPPDPTIG